MGFYKHNAKPTLRTKELPDTLQDRRYPSIADSRIMYFDDKAVAFYYIDTKTKRKIDVVNENRGF